MFNDTRAALGLLALTSALLAAPSLARAQTPEQSFEKGRAVASGILGSLDLQGVGPQAAKPLDSIIAEGDSWFAYPGLDVLGALAGGKIPSGTRYAVYSAAHAGDTVESMAYDVDQLEDLASEFFKARDAIKQKSALPLKAILLSGGGNDIAGPEFYMLLNHFSSVTGPLSPLDSAVADGFIDRIARSLSSLIGTAQQFAVTILERNDVPILIHGYAPPVPDGRPYGIGWPLPGPWLQPGFAAKGYLQGNPTDLEKNTAVMADLINRFNKRIAQIPAELANVSADIRYVDLTKVLSHDLNTYRDDWSNELHPRDSAFQRVAEAFHQRILKK